MAVWWGAHVHRGLRPNQLSYLNLDFNAATLTRDVVVTDRLPGWVSETGTGT